MRLPSRVACICSVEPCILAGYPCSCVRFTVPALSIHARCTVTIRACTLLLHNQAAEKIGFTQGRVTGTAACRHLRLRSSYTEAISSILLMGGDTDTNAAIVGGMIGALHGASSIPDSMKTPVLSRGTDSPGIPRPGFLTTEALSTICQQLHQLAGVNTQLEEQCRNV